MLNGLDLFSGIGGMSLALREYVRPVAHCEIDTYCQGVLLNRMHDSQIPVARIWDDIRTFRGEPYNTKIDIMYGGFPCQDISVAGHGKGLAGERSGLYWEIHRLAKEIKPAFIFLENVPAILCRGGSTVVESLAEMGYDCRWCVISAASVGALHRRERWFLLAYSQRGRRRADATGYELQAESAQLQRQNGQTCTDNATAICPDVADASSPRLEGQRNGACGAGAAQSVLAGSSWREAVSSVRRTTDGVSFRMERIKGLGNSVVPIQAKTAFETLMGLSPPK